MVWPHSNVIRHNRKKCGKQEYCVCSLATMHDQLQRIVERAFWPCKTVHLPLAYSVWKVEQHQLHQHQLHHRLHSERHDIAIIVFTICSPVSYVCTWTFVDFLPEQSPLRAERLQKALVAKIPWAYEHSAKWLITAEELCHAVMHYDLSITASWRK